MKNTFRPILHVLVRLMLAVLLFLPFTACLNEDVCEDIATVPIRIGFAMRETANAEPRSLAVDSLSIHGLDNPVLIYENRNNVSRVELPLHLAKDSVAFVLYIANPIEFLPYVADTLWLYYQRRPVLISMDCGFVTFFDLERLAYSRNFIDTVTIENTSIINNLDEHIKIFPFVAEPAP